MDESDPTPTGISDLLKVPQTFSSVPADVVTYGSRVITKPDPSSTGGILVGNLFDYTASDFPANSGESYSYGGKLFAANTVFSRLPISPSQTDPTGGTYTITYKTSTTAPIAYNAAAALIDIAVNALADVITDGLTVAFINGLDVTGRMQMNITVGATSSRFTADGSSLTPAGSQTVFTNLISTTSQQISVAMRTAVTAHGFSTSLPIVVNTNTSDVSQALLPHGTHWVAVDANTIAYNGEIGGTTGTYIGQRTRDYTPGTDRIGIRFTQKFYLPGVTVGIASPTDIPLPALLLNDADFLAAVIATPTGYLTYDADELDRWNDWPIYTQTFQEINMVDV